MTPQITALDLNTQFPRSPRETMNGLIWVPRLVDKARAARAYQLGEYHFPCPMDQIVLEFLGIESEAFAELVADRTDAAIQTWLQDLLKTTSPEQCQTVNRAILEKQPDSPEKWEKFKRIRDTIDATRSDIQTWAALIDLEENRT